MNTGDDRLFVAAIVMVLILAVGSVWYNYSMQTALSTGAREVDLEMIREQSESGNLSLHEAEFYKPFEGGERGL